MLYLVGLAYLDDYPPDFLDHLVIGTTALSVGLNAYIITRLSIGGGETWR